jgi:fatty-acyl-CoA synthase
LANGLSQLGVQRGDRVAWLGPNHLAFLESLFACGLVGATLAPVNHRLAADQLRAVLENTSPAVLIQHGAPNPALTPGMVRHRITVGGSANGMLDFESLVAGSSDLPVDLPVDMEDLCLLPHTSGTTGTPKGVALTHANVTWNVINLLTCADLRSDDVTVAITPFFRVGGTGVNVLPVLFMGGTVVVPQDTSPDAILEAMQRHRVTVGFGNPDLLGGMAASALWTEADLSSLRYMITGGAPVPERLIEAYLDRGVTLLQGYGLSEAAPLVLLLDPASPRDKLGSAGKPPLLIDIQVVASDGTEVGPGETGELLVRGPNVMAGYWNQPDATHKAISPAGWLRTGDAARIDEQGYVWIVDRIADQFWSAGKPVYPAEVEKILIGHPAIADVAVTQVRAEDGREEVTALVVMEAGSIATEAEILAFANDYLAFHEAPSSVIFVEQLPRNTVGKLARDQIRAQAAARPTD